MASRKEDRFGPHELYLGIDMGKSFHWAVGVDAEGTVTIDRPLRNRQVDVDALVVVDQTPLADRPEWLSPKDLQDVFGIGRSKAFNVCNALPHTYIGRSIRVNKKTIAKEFIEKGRLP